MDRLLNSRIKVHRVDDVQFRMPLGERRDDAADGLKAVAETFSSMSGDKKVRPLELAGQFFGGVALLSRFSSPMTGVNWSIIHEVNAASV